MRGKNGSRGWQKYRTILGQSYELAAFNRFADQRLDLLVRGNELARTYIYFRKV